MTRKPNKTTSPAAAGEPRNSVASTTRRADPHFERESERYENPLPSREYVGQKVAEHGVPAGFEQLCQLLDIQPEERENFERRLMAMERDGQLMRNRRGAFLLPDKADRERLLSLLDRVLADQRVQKMKPSPGQLAMLQRIREALPVQASNVRKLPARSARRAA